MCTIAILFQTSDAPLVIAANRDELYARPASGPSVIDERARVVGGVDELSGGTWLAVRADGQFAAVTNQRALAPATSGVRSRGHAVRELAAADDQDAYVAALDPRHYASMNLVWGNATRVAVAYVRSGAAAPEIETLVPSVHVLCNDRLGAPGFPRGVRLADAIGDGTAPFAQLAPRLQVALADHTRVPLADVPPSHLPVELARELTATCIHSPLYGTRSSTILAIEPGRVRAYLHADGSPCVTPFVDHTGLLR